MSSQFLHIKYAQIVQLENVEHSKQRKIGEVLVIDRVEMVELDKLVQVRKLHRDYTSIPQEYFQATDEIHQVRHMRQDVVSDDQVRLGLLCNQLACEFNAKEFCDGRNANILGCFCNIAAWFDTQYRDIALHKILQQVAVVAGDLDDRLLCSDIEAVANHVDIVLRMIEPTLGH